MTSESDLTVRRFSTDEFPSRERIARWREEFGRTLVRVDVESTAPDVPFKAEAFLQSVPGLRLALCSGSEVRLNRTRALAVDSDDVVGLIVNLGPPAHAVQLGHDLVLSNGDAVFVRPDEPGALTGRAHLSLVLPRSALALRTSDLDSWTMVPISSGSQPLGLLVNYLRLVHLADDLRKPAVQQAIVNHVHDLAALIAGANRDAQQQGRGAVAAARLAAAVDYIGKSFADPGLTLANVAQRLSISPRYLQELLERSGTPFTARVNELRLNRAFALLLRYPDRSVSEVATRAGFGNVSHFNRLFRKRFGDTPSSVRKTS